MDTLRALEARLRAPGGRTLVALLQLHPCDYLDVKAAAIPAESERFRAEFGVEVLGRTGNGYFGVLLSALGETIDSSPIAYADRQGMPPELAAASLGDFLGLLAYFPDFFQLRPFDADQWEADHVEFWGRDDDDEVAPIRELASIPGVSLPRSAAELGARLEAVLASHPPLPGFRTPEPAAARPTPDSTAAGQNLDITKAKIRAIEIRAYVRLGMSDQEIARELGLDEAAVRTSRESG